MRMNASRLLGSLAMRQSRIISLRNSDDVAFFKIIMTEILNPSELFGGERGKFHEHPRF